MIGIPVIGLHRGGTSAVAGVLFHLGVYMGSELLPPSPHNPRGYFEDSRFVELHTAMLGGDWKQPYFTPIEKHVRNIEQYKVLIGEMAEHELWGIKDPRLCYLYPQLYYTTKLAFPSEMLKSIFVYRDAFSAANSLYKRGGHTLEEARDISLRYQRAQFAILADGLWVYYNDLVACPVIEIGRIADYIGVEVTQKAIDFIDPSLRHWK